MTGWRSALGAAVLGAAGSAPPALTDLHAIALRGGVNRVAGFMPGGGEATIVEGWRDNGNAHGYRVWMVTGARRRDGTAPLVAFEGGADAASRDTIDASPFDGERVTDNVRFATGRIAGRRVSLAIRGDLDEVPSGVIADHATATIRWFRLVHRENAVGEAPDAFVPIGSLRTTRRYCNVDLALRDAAGIPLPRDYAGANRVDGCFPDG
jgi:hypothetical protein